MVRRKFVGILQVFPHRSLIKNRSPPENLFPTTKCCHHIVTPEIGTGYFKLTFQCHLKSLSSFEITCFCFLDGDFQMKMNPILSNVFLAYCSEPKYWFLRTNVLKQKVGQFDTAHNLWVHLWETLLLTLTFWRLIPLSHKFSPHFWFQLGSPVCSKGRYEQRQNPKGQNPVRKFQDA